MRFGVVVYAILRGGLLGFLGVIEDSAKLGVLVLQVVDLQLHRIGEALIAQVAMFVLLTLQFAERSITVGVVARTRPGHRLHHQFGWRWNRFRFRVGVFGHPSAGSANDCKIKLKIN